MRRPLLLPSELSFDLKVLTRPGDGVKATKRSTCPPHHGRVSLCHFVLHKRGHGVDRCILRCGRCCGSGGRVSWWRLWWRL